MDIRVHDLRHTAASLALRNRIPGKVVQEMLGHATYATTMDIYSHVDPGMHKEAALEMNRLLVVNRPYPTLSKPKLIS